MADKPKPFLKKGTGKYTKINYPVLRRSGVYQPPPDSSPRRQEEETRERTPPSRDQRRQQPSHLQYPSSPVARPSPSLPPLPPLVYRAMETGVMGQRSPSVSEGYSRTSDSPPRTTTLGSSLERRMGGESDEGMGRELRSNSPGPNSGRPGTVDSGFPREEMPLSSPVSSAGDTRASSFPSMDEDITRLNLRGNHSEDEILRPLHSPSTPPAVDEDEAMVDAPPAPPSTLPPIPKTRRSVADRSTIGTSTAEFERREQQALRQEPERREIRASVLHSSLSSSTSTITHALTQDVRQLVREVGGDHGEELFPSRSAPAVPTHAANRRDERGRGVVQPQRMIGSRIDSPAGSDASTLSPIDPRGRPASVQHFDGASFHESADRPGSSSHFRIATTSNENSVVDARGRRDEREGRERREGRDGRMVDRSVQHSSVQMQPERRRRNEEEGSEASSGSTAAARRYLLGDRRPLDEVRRRRSSDEITGTQQRPRPQARASDATLRRPPVGIIEESSDEPSDGSEEETFVVRGTRDEERRGEGERRGGRRGETRGERRAETSRDREWSKIEGERERVRLMGSQLRDAIAHNDLSAAAFRREKEELHHTFDKRLDDLSAAYAKAKEALRKMEEEWIAKRDKENTEMEQKRLELEKRERQVRKEEAAKVKEWKTKCEEEQKKAAEEKKKLQTDISKRRLAEDKLKKERDEAVEKAAKLQKDTDRLKKMVESAQREQAVVRGQSAYRFALSRAEDEAAAAPRRNGMQRMMRGGYGGSANGLNQDKENSYPGLPLRSITPPGILKKNQVRFADTTFTVPPPEDGHPFYLVSSGTSPWGPCTIFANNVGKKVRVSLPACGSTIFEYNNGDVRFFEVDRSSHTFHYLAPSGVMQFDFFKEGCQIIYYPDGTLEINRTGREQTRCWFDGEKVRRNETIKRPDGTYYAEIWEDNAMALYDERGMGQFQDQYQIGKKVTERNSIRVGKSYVVLHSMKNVEFYEQNFYAVYCHGNREVILAVNFKKPNEIRYALHPGGKGKISHPTSHPPRCIDFSPDNRWNGS